MVVRIDAAEEHRVEFAIDDGAELRYVDDELPFRPCGVSFGPHRLHKTMPPIEQLAFLRRIARFAGLFDTYDFRFILRKTVDEIRTGDGIADACIGFGIGHDEPFRPCVQTRAELCGRRSDARNRTDQTTPVLTGGAVIHHTGASLQGGDVLAAACENPLAADTDGRIEISCAIAGVGHEMFVTDQQACAQQQRLVDRHRHVIGRLVAVMSIIRTG